MNAGIQHDDAILNFYDSDYPSQHLSKYPENFDAITEYQGIRYDVDRYLHIAAEVGGTVLELCCGSGRVAIPLARERHAVTGVDVSPGMLARCQRKLDTESREVLERVRLIHQDVTELELPVMDFDLCIIAFNSLLCIAEFDLQRKALQGAARHLRPGGILMVDVVNPMCMKWAGDPYPRPFYSRRDPETGERYTRFAMMEPFDAEQRQRLYGWYDLEDEHGVVTRRHYAINWRPIFRFELILMLESAGFRCSSLEGGHRGEPFTSSSPHMFVRAERKS